MSWPLEFCLTQLNSKERAVEAAATASSTKYILATLKLHQNKWEMYS